MADICFTPYAYDYVRITRLEPNGAPSGGEDGSYVTTGVTLGRSVEREDGRRITRDLGNGQRCVDYREPDKETGVTLTTAFCAPGFELQSLLGNGTLYREEVGGTDYAVGYAMADLEAPPSDGVAIEAWIRALDGQTQAIDPRTGKAAWILFVWPRVRWARDGEQTWGGDDVSDTAYRGIVEPNNNFIDPYQLGIPTFTGPELQYLVDEDSLPTVQCGFQDLLTPVS